MVAPKQYDSYDPESTEKPDSDTDKMNDKVNHSEVRLTSTMLMFAWIPPIVAMLLFAANEEVTEYALVVFCVILAVLLLVYSFQKGDSRSEEANKVPI